jgi:type II secretory pathway predicted ATPase ExeA
MYQDHWKLTERPFDNTSDARFFFASEGARAALLKLRYVVESRQPAAMLAASSGLGKTIIAQALLGQLGDFAEPRLHLVFPQMPPDQLVAYLCESLNGEPSPQAALHQSVRKMEQFLAKNHHAQRHAVVVIDEAHLLRDAHALQTMRLLLNLEVNGKSPWTIILVGQPALLPQIERVPDLEERLAVKCTLRRYDAIECADYVRHRLAVAGAKPGTTIFDSTALEVLFRFSHGVPRRINRLADLSMMVGFAEERTTITASDVESVAQELTAIPAE